MLFEVELRRHRDTHRLLAAATSQLASWASSTSDRLVSYHIILFIRTLEGRGGKIETYPILSGEGVGELRLTLSYQDTRGERWAN